MTDAERDELYASLEVLEARLAASLSNDEQAPAELDQARVGRLSRMDAMQQQQMAAAGRRGLLVRQRQVRAALERIGRDEYGDCLSCDEPIALARLRARPESPFCVDCQGRRER